MSGSKDIALTVHEDRAYVHPVLDAGARGYLLKRSAGEELLRAVRAVYEGALYLDPAIADKASTRAPEIALASEEDGGELSRREEDVLKLVSQGFSNKQIAGQLEISVKSVETYKARASEKKGLHSRADIVRHGIKQGWLTTSN